MIENISYLPLRFQEELKVITNLILEKIPDCEMIILYGSYAKNKYVWPPHIQIEYEERTEYVSDYDIAVITAYELSKEQRMALNQIEIDLYKEKRPPLEIENYSIDEISENILNWDSTQVEIQQDGIFLYNTHKYKLPVPPPLNNQMKYRLSLMHFQQRFTAGENFFAIYQDALQRKLYQLATFLLHQACDNYFHAILSTFNFITPKLHDLNKLLILVEEHVPEIRGIFQLEDEKDRYIFTLLRDAYKNGRYNKNYRPSEEEVLAQQKKTEEFHNFTQKVCQIRIEEYRLLAEQEINESYLYKEEERLVAESGKNKKEDDGEKEKNENKDRNSFEDKFSENTDN